MINPCVDVRRVQNKLCIMFFSALKINLKGIRLWGVGLQGLGVQGSSCELLGSRLSEHTLGASYLGIQKKKTDAQAPRAQPAAEIPSPWAQRAQYLEVHGRL